ncbi:MAG: hypothetical protein EAX90_02580 [Candidatus Heimdallarchaeota archaeon]|nr:hypothetical protein [Candidatus Heimdallarchaeota archaeon]
MNPGKIPSLWDSIPDYKRRNPDSVNPPSERIDPDLPGAHFWVIIVTNWKNIHPLMQDVLYDWYKALSQTKGNHADELDPSSTEALYKRLNVLDQKLTAFDLERTNLEQELQIRDRDFQRLRSITGKQQKENIEVQHELGKSFQEKIMMKQEEIDKQSEQIKKLELKIQELSNTDLSDNTTIATSNNQITLELQKNLEEKINILQNLSLKVDKMTEIITKQEEIIDDLQKQIEMKDEKIKEIKDLLKL